MIIENRIAQKKYLYALLCCLVAETLQGMMPQYSDTQPKYPIIPFVIGATCIVGAAGLYYFYRLVKKDATTANPDNRGNNQSPEQTIPDDGTTTYTFKIKYRDMEVERTKKYTLALLPITQNAFEKLKSSSANETIAVDVVKNDHELTFQLLKKLFAEGGAYPTKSTLKDSEEYCFFIGRMNIFQASEEVKKKIASKYCLPKIEELLSPTWLSDERDWLTKSTKQVTIEMIDYLPTETKLDLENKLYGLRFKTKKFQTLCSTVNTLTKQITSFIDIMQEKIHNSWHYDYSDDQSKYPNNARLSFDSETLRTHQLPILSCCDSFKGWYNSFEYRLYEQLRKGQTNRISCLEFTNIKQKHPLNFSSKTSNEQTKGNIFTCARCNKEYTLPSHKIYIDTQDTVACKECVKLELNGRVVDLYDCHNLDRVSLCRLIHKAYNYEGSFNAIKEEDSEAYEDIPHGNRLHLPLLQLLLKYYGIRYYEGDGAHGCRAYLNLGLYPVLLDDVDIKILPTFRTGDNNMYDSIECIIHHENEINELLTTTKKVLPTIPKVVTITYIKQDIYHLYGCIPWGNKITLDVTALRTKLAHYFYKKGNWPNSNSATAKQMKNNDSTITEYIKQLKQLSKLYNFDYGKLKQSWEWWWHDYGANPNRYIYSHDYATIIVTLPIKHKYVKNPEPNNQRCSTSN